MYAPASQLCGLCELERPGDASPEPVEGSKGERARPVEFPRGNPIQQGERFLGDFLAQISALWNSRFVYPVKRKACLTGAEPPLEDSTG